MPLTSFQKTVITLLVLGVAGIVGAEVIVQKRGIASLRTEDYIAATLKKKEVTEHYRKGTVQEFIKVVLNNPSRVQINNKSDCAKLKGVSKTTCEKIAK